MTKYNDDQKELLAELRESPAWEFFAKAVIMPMIEARGQDILSNCAPDGSRELTVFNAGARSALVLVLAELYPDKVPEHIANLRRKI